MNKVVTFVKQRWMLLVVVFVVFFAIGYQVGKGTALRENAREAAGAQR